MSRPAVEELLELLKKDPEALHALLFEPDRLAGSLSSREAKALVYGVDPERFVRGLTGTGDVEYCTVTCSGDSTCVSTCGDRSCDETCGGQSCTDTCKSSCGKTT
jgi:hypothetical protein